MGTIMAVVAVLLIHMDRKAVGNMNPNIRNLLVISQDNIYFSNNQLTRTLFKNYNVFKTVSFFQARLLEERGNDGTRRGSRPRPRPRRAFFSDSSLYLELAE